MNEFGLCQNDQMTFREVFEEWFKQHRREVEPSTVYAMESKFSRRILPVFSPYKMKDISCSYCQKTVNAWAQELKTFNDNKIQANLVFRYAMKMDIIKRNPMDYVKLPKLKHEMEYNAELEGKKYYTREELRTFLDSIQEDDMAISHVSVVTRLHSRAKGGALCLALV